MHTDLAGATEKLSGRHGGRRQWGARVGLGFEGGDAAEIGGEAEQERREMRRTLAEEGGGGVTARVVTRSGKARLRLRRMFDGRGKLSISKSL
jgi:hypothetical protein